MFFHANFAQMHTTKIYDWDLIADVPGLSDFMARVGERPSVKQVQDQMQAGMKALAARK